MPFDHQKNVTSFLTKLSLDLNPLFYQHVTQELFETIISKRLAIKEVANTQSTETLTLEEEMWLGTLEDM